jgi:hypothetical protein
MATVVPMGGAIVQFLRKSPLYGVTNTESVYVHALILDVKDQPVSAVVEYKRYNGSSSPLGLWTNMLQVVPVGYIYEVGDPE